MTQFRYQLKNKPKVRCPQCGQKTFSLYVNVITQQPKGEQYGRCDRIEKCNYINYPKDDKADDEAFKHWVAPKIVIPKTEYIPKELAEKTFRAYQFNYFFKYLCRIFNIEKAYDLASKYNLGTAQNGGVIYWQQDVKKRFRTGKIMKYGLDGKRIKNTTGAVDWIHTRIKKNFPFQQCFFGEHLLAEYPDMPVALCESEKTAIIMSEKMPQFIWLASGGAEMLNAERLAPLMSRDLTIFPDDGQFSKWKAKTEFIPNRKMDLTVKNSDCEKGADILDLIL